MSVTSATGSFITLSAAQTMVGDWITAQSSVSTSNPKAYGLGSNKLLDILNQRDCVGLRIYNCKDNGNNNVVVIGVDTNGDDMDAGYILNNAAPCPTTCGANPLA